jgi:hypothetical protein
VSAALPTDLPQATSAAILSQMWKLSSKGNSGWEQGHGTRGHRLVPARPDVRSTGRVARYWSRRSSPGLGGRRRSRPPLPWIRISRVLLCRTRPAVRTDFVTATYNG